ncbi:MAG TPA: LysR family transcriptional regulator [Casimicrobiaceae bacterium]|jgi:DNA-binding transcriptional LysR family regulator
MRPLLARVKLRQLALVAALEDLRSLRRAAEAVAVTQPAATRLLRELEQALGQPLFVRHAWGMEPTPYGTALTRYARSVLTEVDEAQSEIAALASGARGVLRIGAVTGAVPGLLVPALRALRRSRPGVRVYLLVNTSDVLVDALAKGTLDVAIGGLPERADPGIIEAVPLSDEPLCVVARTSHPLARKRHAGAADLASASWVLQPPGSPLRQEANAMLERLGVRLPADVIETASIVATLALLRDTDALSIVPEDLAAHYGAPGWITRLRTGVVASGSRYELITRRGRTLGPAGNALIAAVRGVAGQRNRARAARHA